MYFLAKFWYNLHIMIFTAILQKKTPKQVDKIVRHVIGVVGGGDGRNLTQTHSFYTVMLKHIRISNLPNYINF